MWISRRTDYATRALLALALAGRPAREDPGAGRRTDTPVSVLEQVLPQLRSAGIVRSERGPSGGYRLNHPPEDITLEQASSASSRARSRRSPARPATSPSRARWSGGLCAATRRGPRCATPRSRSSTHHVRRPRGAGRAAPGPRSPRRRSCGATPRPHLGRTHSAAGYPAAALRDVRHSEDRLSSTGTGDSSCS